MHAKLRSQNLKEGDHAEDLGIVNVIIEWILRKQSGKLWIGFIWLRTETNGRLL